MTGTTPQGWEAPQGAANAVNPPNPLADTSYENWWRQNSQGHMVNRGGGMLASAGAQASL